MSVTERVFARRTLMASFGALGLARLLAACSSNEKSALPVPNNDYGNTTPSRPATDQNEYVPGENPTPVDAGDAPKVPNASWEARVKQLEALGPIYTLAAPGPWAGKERSHIPQASASGPSKVTVVVSHVMGANGLDAGYVDAAPSTDSAVPVDAGTIADAGRDAAVVADGGVKTDAGAPPPTAVHYITTIYLKSDTGVVVGLWEFASTDPAPPTVTFTLPAGVTSVTAHEFCTLHGLWAADPLIVTS